MPLAPRTLNEYRGALKRLGAPVTERSNFGDLAATGGLPQMIAPEAYEHLTNSGRLMLRAALRWAYTEAGQEEFGKQVAAQIELRKELRVVKKNPSHDDTERFVERAKDLDSPWREILLIGVAVGFRREELLTLPREAVESAVKSEDKLIRFVRKGSVEGELPIHHVLTQFKVLLRQPVLLGSDAALGKNSPQWEIMWQILGSSFRSAYERLKRKVSSVAIEAGCSSHWTPHVMRHAFASEMARDGATLPFIQRALSHASYQTSLRYVHMDAVDLRKFMKPRGDSNE
jgi:site-specific recombinase XerD